MAFTTVSWLATAGASGYRMHIREAGGSLVQTPYIGTDAVDPSTGEASYTIEGLAEGTYEWRVRPIFDSGPGAFSSWSSVELADDAPPSPPSPPPPPATGGEGEAELSWDSDSGARAYRVQIRDGSGSLLDKPYVPLSADPDIADGTVDVTLADISDLPEGSYEFRVRSIYENGSGPFSEWQDVTTGDTPPSPPPPPPPPPGGEAQLSWATDPEATAYRVHVRDESGTLLDKPYVPLSADPDIADGTVDVALADISDLPEGSYEFRVRSIYEDGAGAFSPWQAVEQGPEAPSLMIIGDSFTVPSRGFPSQLDAALDDAGYDIDIIAFSVSGTPRSSRSTGWSTTSPTRRTRFPTTPSSRWASTTCCRAGR